MNIMQNPILLMGLLMLGVIIMVTIMLSYDLLIIQPAHAKCRTECEARGYGYSGERNDFGLRTNAVVCNCLTNVEIVEVRT